ncbi:DUF3515 domain-containing protein [Nocardioides panacisoli]|uniref:DUF3515 domain-containing protein n=1 Tax=Nocardioides panacisoli TaxID=627624 RepID=A0ABP7I0Q5_9ACTN
MTRAALLLLPLLLVSACGGPVQIDAGDLSDADAKACAAFVDELPETLDDLDRVDVQPAGAPGAAYGDPAIVITCGVGQPDGYHAGASCESVAGVDWFVPDGEYTDHAIDVTLTSAWSRPRVEVQIPKDYWPEATAAATGVLSPIVEKHMETVGHCQRL